MNVRQGIRCDSSDIIAKKFATGGQIFVRPLTREGRIELIEFLESEGFSCLDNPPYSRQSTIESPFPLLIELSGKSIRHLSNVACSAAAASAGVIMNDRDFYLLYSLYSVE